ncbi:uncharacterized protein LOC142554033 [Primulina tabacum]|uniref:uncharacterized protein LOC142554033 n=1 Tax=Primulina tabacum TaxID=48773 RepID=UPI003F59D904
MEDSPSAIAPLILRNLLTSLFILADKPLIHLVQKSRLLLILNRFLVSAFLFFLGLLPSLFPSLRPSAESHDHPLNPKKDDISSARGGGGFRYGGRSGVERALTQLLLIMNDIPVSSRKYEVVRSLAEKLIDENLSGKNQEALKEVNCAVLAAAFARTLSQLESAVAEQGRRSGNDGGGGEVTNEGRGNDYLLYTKASRLFRGVRYCGQVAWSYAKPRDELSRSRSSAEKLAAEILWLAQKMAASGCADEAVRKWAASTNLAWLALTTEPRLQGSLVKVAAFLIKQAKELGSTEEEQQQQEEPHNDALAEQQKTRQIKMKMLISWLPLLCAANNGTDAPIVNMSERVELEMIMEDIIWTLDDDHEEQERVLSVWLHHFSYCSASDWPNLRSCYTQWFAASRTRLLQALPAGQHLGSN